MNRYVVSAQHSGMNWLRFCIETYYGQRTPGATSVLTANDCPETVIIRSHDALNLTGRSTKTRDAWATLAPEGTLDDVVLLILRDPLETFVRMAKKDWGHFRGYLSNIAFYDRAASSQKDVVYYDDLILKPSAMLKALEALRIGPADGYSAPTLERITADWDEFSNRSRGNYDVKQARIGGAQTKDAPTDMKFHQRNLSPEEKRQVWVYLQLRLSRVQLMLLERYFPVNGLPRPSLLDRWRFRKL